MQKFMALYKKELKIFFSLPIAYAVMTVFQVLSGYFFSNIAAYYSMMSMKGMNQYYRSMMDLSMVDGIFRPFFHNLVVVLILMVPLITMRMFAEEKREGTAELMFTLPVDDLTLVSSKFAAAFTVYLAMLAGSLSSFIILRTTTSFELLPVLSGFLGLALLGASFIAIGLFISSLTESQIVAAVASFGVLLMFLVISWAASSAGPVAAKILTNLSITQHFDSFAKGLLDTADISYYLCFIALFFFLNLRVLESKQWRG